MAKPSGEIIETPITTNFREGLSVLQCFISTHGARKGGRYGAQDRELGYLTRRLSTSQDTIISEFDCGTRRNVEMMLIEGGEIIERLGDRTSAASCSRTSSIRTPARCCARPTPRSPRITSRSSTTPASTR
jgi:DNA-directed RNA polymerase beta' subunit